MLSRSTIQVWEGCALRGGEVRESDVDGRYGFGSGLIQWRALRVGRRTVRVSGGRGGGGAVCAQGIPAAPVEGEFKQERKDAQGFVRARNGGASQLRVNGDGVRVEVGEGEGDPNGASDVVSRLAGVALRLPAPPVGEGSRGDSDESSSSGGLEGGAIGSNGSSVAPVQEVEVEAGQEVESGRSGGVVAQPVLRDKGKRDGNAFEKFARARAAGRELAQRSREAAGLGSAGAEGGKYYAPKIGDCVMGVVASGSFRSLDVNVGAKELGHLFRKDVMPLDICSVRKMSWEFPDANSPVVDPPRGPRSVCDDEVLNLAIEAPMAVELGTVLTMEVMGMTPSGRALLSARSVAREYAWQRVHQLHEYNATLEVEIVEWTSAGLVSRVEGLRAFLPIYYLVNRAPEPATSGSVSYKEYVGQKFTVMISSVDESRRNLVISEKKAWMTKNAYIGALLEGIVTGIQSYGVHIRVKDTDISGVLHISNITQARVDNIASVFSVGEEVKVMVVPSSKRNKLSFSTVELEREHGLLLRNKEVVFQDAERVAAEIATAYRRTHSESTLDSNDSADLGGQRRVIANWDWLDFGDRTELDQ